MRSGMNELRICLGLGVSVLATNAVSYAAVVNVDINSSGSPTYANVAAAPDSGTVWNGYAAGTYYDGGDPDPLANLFDSTGSPTAVSFDLNSRTGYDDSGANDALQRDYVYANGFNSPSTVTFTLSGLATDGTTYNLYLYDGVANHSSRFTINGTSQDVTPASSFGAANTFVEGTNYTVFSGLLPVAGTITGTLSAVPGGGEADFNGVQLVAVPEPSTAFLTVFGIFAAASRRRKLV